MRDFIRIHVNGTPHRVRSARAFSSLASFLRYDLALTGTKTVCSEGDCGSCSVLLGRLRQGRLEYESVNSCIQYLFQLDGTHIVTVEGLAEGEKPGALQEAFGRHHASQCGYCTPGFIVSLTGWCEQAREAESPAAVVSTLRRQLVGNLCRCTGYLQILEAASSVNPADVSALRDRFDEETIVADVKHHEKSEIRIEETFPDAVRTVFCPRDLGSASAFLQEHPEARIVGGATDLGVAWNRGQPMPGALLSLSRVAGLDAVTVEGETLVLGAAATWASVETTARDAIPELYHLLQRFGSPQIRRVATVAGNLVNASPLADSLPFFYVSETEVEVVSSTDRRRIAMDDFYEDYKKTTLEPTELIHSLRLQLPRQDESLRLYKVSKRRDMDLSTVTAAIRVRRTGDVITEARLAYGAVAAVVVRLPQAEAFLSGKPFTEDVFREAGRIAAGEIAPISDVRGSAAFRLELARNLPLKFYHDSVAGSVEASAASE